MRELLELPNECYCTKPKIYPKNWKTCGKSGVKKYWYIEYVFTNEKEESKIVRIKNMNDFKDLHVRREASIAILEDEINALKDGYNPILEKYVEIVPKGTLHENLLTTDALRLAFKKLETTQKYKNDVKNCIDRVIYAINRLNYDKIKIKDFKRRQLKECFDKLKLTNHSHNKFKSYISSLYRILIEYECADMNITRDIYKRKTVKNQRKVLPYNEALELVESLEENHYNFYRYSMIFLHSGSRSTEMLSIQKKHVNLEKQEYKVLIKKGKLYEWRTKVILKKVLPLWREIYKEAKKEDYLFSYKLMPGEKRNESSQITRRWKKHVKFKKGIDVDFYSLKHTFLDHIEKVKSIEHAKEMASHNTTKMTKVYTIYKQTRENEKLKKMVI